MTLDRERLLAAIENAGLNVHALAKASRRRISQQQLHNYVNGLRQPPRSIARWLAEQLGVTVEWLARETDFLPYRVRGAGTPAAAKSFPRAYLARHAYLRECEKALRRDLVHLPGTASEQPRLAAVYMLKLLRLIMPQHWRLNLLVFNAGDPPRPRLGTVDVVTLGAEDMSIQGFSMGIGDLMGDLTDADHEEMARCLAKAGATALAPWFQGRARLNYAALETWEGMFNARNPDPASTPIAQMLLQLDVVDSPQAAQPKGKTHA